MNQVFRCLSLLANISIAGTSYLIHDPDSLFLNWQKDIVMSGTGGDISKIAADIGGDLATAARQNTNEKPKAPRK